VLGLKSTLFENSRVLHVFFLNFLEVLLAELLVPFLVLCDLSHVKEFVFESEFHFFEFSFLEDFLFVLKLFHQLLKSLRLLLHFRQFNSLFFVLLYALLFESF
jgi:hypothetical protein